MTSWLYTAETGLTDGTNVTVANSDDGTAGFAFTPTKSGTGTVKFSSASPIRGALSIQYTALAANDVGRSDITGLFSSSNIVLDLAFRTPSYASLTCRIVELLAASVFAVRINISTAGRIEVYNAANTLVWTSTSIVSTATGGWRLGLRCVPATSTTGTLQLSYYSTYGALVATETMTTITNGNFGTAPIDAVRIGKITSTPTWAALYSDDWQIDNARVTLFDAPPYEVSAGSDQIDVEPWSTVTLTATSSSGTAVWSNVSGPSPALSGSGPLIRTFIAPASFTAATSVFRATNGPAIDDVSITYLPATDGIVASTGPVVVTPIRITRKT